MFVGATAFMPPAVYSSWWWMTFWCVIALAICIVMRRKQLWHRPAVFILHLSFLLMLAGGGTTALTAKRGTLHLSPGITADIFVAENGDSLPLPTAITLKKFEPEYYPGMSIPRDFHSYLETAAGIKLHISMNHIGHIDGYRLYQTGFDGLGGSTLTVAHDPAGITLSYCGYLLFAISGFIILVSKRRPDRSAKAKRICLLPLLILCASTASAVPAIGENAADSLESRQVIFRGRVVPFGVMASELTCKLTGQVSVGALSASRFVASLIVFDKEWRNMAFIEVKDKRLRQALGVDGKYVSVGDLYDDSGKYLPETIFEDGKGSLDSEILKLDEKAALLAELWSGKLFTPLVPGAPESISNSAINSQLLYVHTKPSRLFFILTLSTAVLALIISASGRRFPIKAAAWSLSVAGLFIFAWRWTTVGHIPLSNAAEIMSFAATALCVISAIASRQTPLSGILGLLMAGFTGLVAWLSFKDPALTPLMPVLASPWLAVHVSLVMVAYAILGFTLPMALAAFVMPHQRIRLASLSVRFIAPGVYLLGLGIFVGAMWANVSWGRYWAWDPKETWALATMMLYAVVLHPSLGLRRRPTIFHIYVTLAFLSIIMTYAGVNYLPSQHAYQ